MINFDFNAMQENIMKAVNIAKDTSINKCELFEDANQVKSFIEINKNILITNAYHDGKNHVVIYQEYKKNGD